MRKLKFVSFVFFSILGMFLLSRSNVPKSANRLRVPAEAASYVNAVEVVPPDEAPATEKIRAFIEAGLRKQYPPGVRPALRDVHAKSHGCVRASFQVSNEQLPAALRVGVFAQNKSFPAWIRYSNGNGEVGSDKSPGPRGMAVKLMNVSGEKLLPEEKSAQTQDFLMINGPTFFVENVSNYVSMITGSQVLFFATHLHDLNQFRGILARNVANPLASRYWSETPYALGPAAMKFSAVPCSSDENASVDRSDPDFLRHAMIKSLATGDACFNFMVQLQTDVESMPIEDPTIDWSEVRSPFIPVAQMKIPAQGFDDPAQQTFCENLAFTPWHSLPEHRPLGGINRTRRVVYSAISQLRHSMNGIQGVEPSP